MLTDIEEKLCRIIETMNEGRNLPPVEPLSDLFQEGLLDSFGLLEFLSRVEEEFDVKFEDKDLTKLNFSKISALAKFIEFKRKREAC